MAASTTLGRLLVELALDKGGFDNDLKDAEKKLTGFSKTAYSMGSTLKNDIVSAFKMAAAAASLFVGAVGGIGGALAKGAIETGATFETLETRLGTLLGSVEAGKARMAELFVLATSTPFELNQIVEAEVNLRALGLAAEDVLPMVMDFAGAMGVDLPGAAVEVGRAMQFGAGAVESMAGRALRAQVEIRTGSDALKMSAAEFREELVKTLTDPDGIFAGGTAKLATTFAGLSSNLADSWTKFQKQVADSGFFAAIKEGVVQLLKFIDEGGAEVADLADTVGRALTLAVEGAVLAVGYLYDGWTLFRLGVQLANTPLRAIGLAIIDIALFLSRAVDTLLVLHKLAGDPLGLVAGVQSYRAELETARGIQSALLSTGIDEAAKLTGELGKGSEKAGEMVDAMEAAAQAARAAADGTAFIPPAAKDAAAAVGEMGETFAGIPDYGYDIAAGLDQAWRVADAFNASMEETLGVAEEASTIFGMTGEGFTTALGAVEGGIEGIVTLIAGPIAGAIAGFVLDMEGTITDLEEQLLALPETLKSAAGLITGLVVTIVEKVVPKLVAAMPEIADSLVQAITSPEFLAAVAKWALTLGNPVFWAQLARQFAADLLMSVFSRLGELWNDFASGAMFDAAAEFIVGVVEGMKDAAAAFIEGIKDFFAGLFDGEKWKDAGNKVVDGIKEVFTLGTADTASYGDTPGVVKAGVNGLVAGFRSNDYVAAAQSPQRLAEMVGARMGGAAAAPAFTPPQRSAPVSVTNQIDVIVEGERIQTGLNRAAVRGTATDWARAQRAGKTTRFGIDRHTNTSSGS